MNRKACKRLGWAVAVALGASPILWPLTRSQANISGSAHDFSRTHWNYSGQTCTICHEETGKAMPRSSPLWGRSQAHSFKLYSSETMNAKVGQPGGSSLVCLGCHDGTVAANSVPGGQNDVLNACESAIGTELNRQHPISFKYDSALAAEDGQLYDPATRTVPALGGRTIRAALLEQDQLECTSCHDVHRIKGQSAENRYSLILSDGGGQLCLICHNK